MVREIILLFKKQKVMANLYQFKIKLVGWGDTPEEAWEAATENFSIEREALPKSKIIDND